MIMDGNKRWSKKNKISLGDGYLKGLNKINLITNICIKHKIKYLTLYALSSENINRSSVSVIYKVLANQYKNLLKEFNSKKEIKINIFGEKKNLPKTVLNIINDIETSINTKNDYKLNLNIAFNYGTDLELVNIVNKILQTTKNEELKINKNSIKKYGYLGNIPDPDLLIRTGGHKRLSNFILLNLSYTELFFIDTLWPDLKEKEIIEIFSQYKKIERKYGL